LGNLTDEGTLLNNDIYDVNIRFMWNWKTNKISRAYVGPTGDKQSQFLMLKACEEIQDTVGNKLNPAEGDILDEENDIYAARFTDTQNWIYERTIQVKPRTRVKLYASYPNGYHIYIENNTDAIIKVIGEDTDKVLIEKTPESKELELTNKTEVDFSVIDSSRSFKQRLIKGIEKIKNGFLNFFFANQLPAFRILYDNRVP
jgi:hypothetical protein